MTNIQQLINEYLDYSTTYKGFSKKTTDVYECNLNLFSKYFYERSIHDIEQLDRRSIIEFVKFIGTIPKPKRSVRNGIEDNLSKRTISGYITCVRNLLKYAKVNDIPCINWEGIEQVKVENYTRSPIAVNDIVKLIEAPYKFEENYMIAVRNSAYMQIAFETGCRLSEICNLMFSHIDKVTLMARVQGKGGKLRFVKLSSECYDKLIEYKELRNDEHDRVFITHNRQALLQIPGGPMHSSCICDFMHKYKKALGIQNVCSHQLRHSFATTMFDQGVKIEYISKMMGHSEVITTMNYIQVSNQKIEEMYNNYHTVIRNKSKTYTI